MTAWAGWLRGLETEPGGVVALLDSELPVKPLEDEVEQKAIEQSLQSIDQRVVFLSQDDRRLLGLRLGDGWLIRRIDSSVPADQLAELLEYTVGVTELIGAEPAEESDSRSYLSFRPLIYGGDYWLNTISLKEINRFDSLDEDRTFSVLLLEWSRDQPLHSLLESIRRGDRVGYFPGFLAVLCPFTSHDSADKLLSRLQRNYIIHSSRQLTYRAQFQNHPELVSRVETFR